MNTLNRWDPFREMLTFRNMVDRMFDDQFGRLTEGTGNEWNLALDVSEADEGFVVKASLPGIKPEDVNITFENNVLTIQGETRDEQETKDQRYYLRERRYGTFSRSIQVPATIKADAIEAHYENGVLTLHLPKAEEAKPKRIAIKGSSAPQMIEGKSKDIANKN